MTGGVSLSKVSLEKKGQSVSLAKRPSFGEISVNLNWNQGEAKPTGFFKSLLGGGASKSAIDLDLGCLYELQDGKKGVVQALGNAFGEFAGPPYVQLSGDDRSGANADGETLRVNGGRWSDVKRLLVFTFIYDGVPNWDATDGVVTVRVPGEAPIEVRLTGGSNTAGMCGIAMIENVDGEIKVTRLVDYVAGHEALDKAYGWNMRWTAGSKD